MKKKFSLALFLFYFFLCPHSEAQKLKKTYIKSNIDKGFAALIEYDYFKAKRIFYNSPVKHQKLANFGLATIYYRSDNPFHQIDSAYNCIKRCESIVLMSKRNAQKKLDKWHISNDTISKLKSLIEQSAYQYVKKENTIAAYETFMQRYWQSVWIQDATNNRNAIAFKEVLKVNTANAYQDFISKYPTSKEASIAKKNYELCHFTELTLSHTLFAYSEFIANNPQSPYLLAAQDSIFSLAVKNKENESYYAFIKNYPNNKHVNEAWSIIFNNSGNDYSTEFFESFIKKYPEYPFKEAIKKNYFYQKRSLLLLKIMENMALLTKQATS